MPFRTLAHASHPRYGREVVQLKNEGRWVFLNTLFSVSEAVMYAQLVDRLDLVSRDLDLDPWVIYTQLVDRLDLMNRYQDLDPCPASSWHPHLKASVLR